jgi:hypothetical protein
VNDLAKQTPISLLLLFQVIPGLVAMASVHKRSEEERLALFTEASSSPESVKLVIGHILQRRFPLVCHLTA